LQAEDQVPLDIIGTMDRLFTEWLLRSLRPTGGAACCKPSTRSFSA
jgi:hypothetical protein